MSVVHEHVALLCCIFSRKVLVTILNLGYAWYLVKDFLYDQLTISDWSEDVKTKQGHEPKCF